MQKIIILLGLVLSFQVIALEDTWLLIDTKKKTVDVRQGRQRLARFKKISLGKNGAGYKQERGDNVTPIGKYKITHINKKSRFKFFFGLNYPALFDADRGISRGRINYTQYLAIQQAHSRGAVPPQTTPLGGAIGIHGVGSGNALVQGEFDWTQGCIALSNKQIEQLERWIYIGMQVDIK